MSPDMSAQIQLWRQKAREGTLTPDEMRLAIAALRRDRIGASVVSDTSRAKKATAKSKANVNSDDLLSELDGF